MKFRILLVLYIFTLTFGCFEAQASPNLLTTKSMEGVEVVGVGFSPGGSAEKWVIAVVKSAKKELRISAYTFTSRPIANAVVEAKQRGVDVAILLNAPKPSEKSFIIPFFLKQKIPLRLSSCKGLMHNKFIVADGQIVQTGSFNYTKAAATANAENVIVLRGAACAKTYLKEWNRLWTEAQFVAVAAR